MKQLLQSVSTGQAIVTDVPAPLPQKGEILVRVGASLISAGTERTAVEFAGMNLVQKAMSRPDLVRQVIAKVRREGILSTIGPVRNRLDTNLALGYSNAGSVIALGEGVRNFRIGDRVACAGGGYASHAEVVRVPVNLVASIPDRSPLIPYDEAAFTTVGAIALQGLRLAELQLGETVAIIGLGLVGLIAIQLAHAAGCHVIGMDVQVARCQLARSLGCDDTTTNVDVMRAMVAGVTDSHGADAVLITAATPSNSPVELAGELARQRGRVVVVGAVGLQLPRKTYYEKELSFRISCSYGPGRYDCAYEEQGHDYPIGFARWTENRNMRAVLDLISRGKVDVRSLITHRFPIDSAADAYKLIGGKSGEPSLGVVITYGSDPDCRTRIELADSSHQRSRNDVSVGLLGAGNFATSVLLPAMKVTSDVRLSGICAATGATAHTVGSRFQFRYCTTDQEQILRDPDINTVVIATRHHLHARQVEAALKAGKHVFCEKPLCTSPAQLQSICKLYTSFAPEVRPLLMVGFNRRFSAMGVAMHSFVRKLREPMMITYRVNAGYIPPTHWTQHPEQGGRVIGEVCHFVDFCTYLADSHIVSLYASALPNGGRYQQDNIAVTMQYQSGTVANIIYVANGDKSLPKERVEVFCSGAAAVLDDFRRLDLTLGGHTRTTHARLRQDKGHRAEWQAFIAALKTGAPSPISFPHLKNTTLAVFAILQSCSSHKTVQISEDLLETSDLFPEASPVQECRL